MTEKENLLWFETFKRSHAFERFSQRPVAYFCAEYALENRVPTYSGGLGVLAGDVLREAADRGLPLVAIGLYYRLGYQHQPKTGSDVREGTQAASVGLELVTHADGSPLTVNVPIQDRDVAVRAWRWKRHALTTYLLDTDIESNQPGDRTITDRLYVGDKETRLKQELVLGIGGLRLLEALDIHPSVYHLNEGHSAFLSYELVRHEMQERKLGFDEAKQYARRRIVLTNHTLVPAGNEIFSNDLVGLLLTRFAKELQVPASELVKLGLVQQSSSFSMTMLAFRMSSIINSVSRLHARKAKEIWTDHPMVAVTNGVHLPTWDRLDGKDFAPGEFWKEHQAAKERLLKVIEERTGRKWDKNTLLLGWARRITGYKRPLAAIEDVAKFAALARNAGRPVRIVFAGLSHPSDTDGQAILAELRRRTDDELKDVACFIPGYDLDTAQQLVVGCDVWLNTPVVGFEACGTSGMKAALNGALPCSTKDGWIDEVETFKIGWLIESSRVTDDFLRLLEHEIAPMYYERNRAGVPELWEEHMRNARQLIRDQFSATRMLKEYVEMLYT